MNVSPRQQALITTNTQALHKMKDILTFTEAQCPVCVCVCVYVNVSVCVCVCKRACMRVLQRERDVPSVSHDHREFIDGELVLLPELEPTRHLLPKRRGRQ